MRSKKTIAALTALLLLTVFVGRHHLLVLTRVLSTFATFHSYLASHQDTLYRYNVSIDAFEPAGDRPLVIPALIHRISLSEGDNATTTTDATTTSCQRMHPTWTHRVWADQDAAEFISSHYPELWRHYAGYKQTIQRANILRYALLHHFGGVYLDLDVDCLRSLDSLRELSWLTPGAYPAGVNNAFILARPHHPFLERLLDEAAESDLRWGLPYVENMLSTGCMFFSNVWMSYMKNWSGPAGNHEDRLLVLADEDGNLDPHMLRGRATTPLFHHGGASSWHGWDAAAIVLIGKHYMLFAAAGLTVELYAVVVLLRMLRARKGKSSMRWILGMRQAGIVKKEDKDLHLLGSAR